MAPAGARTCAMSAISVITVLLFVSSTVSLNKYSEESNSAGKEKPVERPFRRYKMNLLWEKAQKRLSEPKLKALFTDLKDQDKEEIAYKQLKSEGRDADGSMAEELRQKFKVIMDRFGLADTLLHLTEDDPKTVKYRNNFNNVLEDKPHLKKRFADKKLQKLWDKSMKAGFTDDELSVLHDEFSHHQEKLNEYSQLADSVKPDDSSENLVSKDNEPEDGKSSEFRKKLLKEKHRILKEDFARLLDMSEKDISEKFEFSDAKVYDLWVMAEKGNFTEGELISLKEELRHFEHKIKKLKHYKEELEMHAALDAQKAKKSDGFLKMKETEKHYRYKVDKLHKHLESKIYKKLGRSHNEL